jgi:hypothetical protein
VATWQSFAARWRSAYYSDPLSFFRRLFTGPSQPLPLLDEPNHRSVGAKGDELWARSRVLSFSAIHDNGGSRKSRDCEQIRLLHNLAGAVEKMAAGYPRYALAHGGSKASLHSQGKVAA